MIYFAPMEGITDAIYRKTHHRIFGNIDKYFIPFISPTQDRCLPPREMRAIGPEVNAGLPVVPQILTRDPELFVWLANRLSEMGYTEVNLNLGCPSGTVTAKGKGSGMLQDPDALRVFLDYVYGHTQVPVSIKTRIGYVSVEEWETLFKLLDDYPIYELIVHPRTRQEFYRGDVHLDIYGKIAESVHCPVVYNGNLFRMPDINALMNSLVHTNALMLGRGLLSNPALAREAKGGQPLMKQEITVFHDALYRAYADCYPESIVLGKMREITKYLASSFMEPKKILKMVFKARNADAYLLAVAMLMQHDLCAFPGYDPVKPSQTWP